VKKMEEDGKTILYALYKSVEEFPRYLEEAKFAKNNLFDGDKTLENIFKKVNGYNISEESILEYLPEDLRKTTSMIFSVPWPMTMKFLSYLGKNKTTGEVVVDGLKWIFGKTIKKIYVRK